MYLHVLAFFVFLSCRFTQETQEGRRDRVPDKEGRELMTSPSKNHPNQSSQRRQRQNTRQGTKKTHEQFQPEQSQSEQSERTKRQRTAHKWGPRYEQWGPRYEQNASTTEALVTLLVAISTSHVFQSVLLDYRTCSVLRLNLNRNFSSLTC